MARTTAILLLMLWITGLFTPIYYSLSEESDTSHWIVEKHEKEQEESEEKEFGEIEFVINRSFLLSDLSEIQEDRGSTFIFERPPNRSQEIILPPPEHRT